MMDFLETLEEAEQDCEAIDVAYADSIIENSIRRISDNADQAGKAWCGSWLGYHSRVYYKDLQPVPPGARFSHEWGFMDRLSNETFGDWVEYDADEVYKAITQTQPEKSIEELKDFSRTKRDELEEVREGVLSVLESLLCHDEDSYLVRIKEEVAGCKPPTVLDYVKYVRPTGKFFSRDMTAVQAGQQVPPHVSVQSQIFAIEAPRDSATKLKKAIRKLSKHISNKRTAKAQSFTPGTTVFIGHGRSLLWKELKDFLQDKLNLPWEEFNRVPVAGMTNIARLSDMLNSAAIAFIIMTAEDEQKDNKVHARMNVIHEAGLFQGKLGFTKAIVLLEEGCEEFSNIQGLGQIRFSKGNIKACFQDVREVLEREGLLKT